MSGKKTPPRTAGIPPKVVRVEVVKAEAEAEAEAETPAEAAAEETVDDGAEKEAGA